MKVYTQAELEGMNDQFINSIAIELEKSNEKPDYLPYLTNNSSLVFRKGDKWIDLDYCNNWGDCGALIDECGIIADGYGFAEGVSDDDRQYRVKCDVKRAVTIVYILIKQGE